MAGRTLGGAKAASAVALTVGLAGCRLAHQTPPRTPSPATAPAPAAANLVDLVRQAGFTVDPGSESGRPAPGDARFANGQLSTAHGTETLSLLVFESTQKRNAYAANLTRSGPDFRYVIGDRLVAYLGAAHSTGPHGQDVTTFPLSPQTVADRLGGTLLPPTPPPQPKTENPPPTSP